MTIDTAERQIRWDLLDGQRRVLERITSGASLEDVLDALVRLMEDQADGLRCAVLLADLAERRLRFVAAPNIPKDYKTGIEPFLRIAPNMGSCGTAAFLREPVYARDVASDARWKDCSRIALRNGLRAVWSTPILSETGTVLGTFAMYSGAPRLPTAEEIQFIDMATQMARVAIERRRHEERFCESEQRFSRLIELMPVAVYVCDTSGAIQSYNKRAVELWGRTPKLMDPAQRYCGSLRLYSPDGKLVPHEESKMAEVLRTGVQVRDIDVMIERPDGSRIWVLVNIVPLRDGGGELVGAMNCFQDITEHMRAEGALRDAASQLQALSRRLVELQESERKELARELHDRVGQSLTALNINLEILRQRLSGHDADVSSRLEDSAGLVESSMQSIENVLGDLRPQMLDAHGLKAALEWYARQFSARTGTAVSVRASDLDDRMPVDVEIALFRIAQEGLNNVAKHARASKVEIALDCRESECVMSVTDDGVGLGASDASSDKNRIGLGMVTMRERAQVVGGDLQVESLPGRGARITVRIPR